MIPLSNRHTGGKKSRIAWFSVGQHDQESLSAYATRMLVPRLRDQFEIELFSDRSASATELFPVTHHYLCCPRLHQEKPFDLFFYHLEDRKEANFLRIALAQQPGVVWFHDLFFTTHGPEPILNSAWKTLVQKFRDASIAWPDPFDEHPQEKPFARRAASFAITPIFSNALDRSQYLDCQVRDLIGEASLERSFYLPLPVPESRAREEDEAAQDESSAREKVVIFGSARIEHRAHLLLQALVDEEIEAEKIVWMLSEGERTRALELLAEFNLSDVQLVSPKSPEKWLELLKEAAIAFHLSFSAFGQLGPYLWLSLASGVPCVTSRFGAGSSLPESVTFQIDPGVFEESQLRAVLKEVFGGDFKAPCLELQSYARELFEVGQVGEQLASVFHRVIESPEYQEFVREWGEFQAQAEAAVHEAAFSFQEGALCATPTGTSLPELATGPEGWLQEIFEKEVVDRSREECNF